MANNEATTLGTVLGLLYPGFPQKKERYITFALLIQHAAWRGCSTSSTKKGPKSWQQLLFVCACVGVWDPSLRLRALQYKKPIMYVTTVKNCRRLL